MNVLGRRLAAKRWTRSSPTVRVRHVNSSAAYEPWSPPIEVLAAGTWLLGQICASGTEDGQPWYKVAYSDPGTGRLMVGSFSASNIRPTSTHDATGERHRRWVVPW
jgi:hypothetical protein